MHNVVESIDNARKEFYFHQQEFLFLYGMRALSTLNPVTFREHGFWSEQIEPHHLANYFDVFHENRFDVYKGAIGALSEYEATALNEVRKVYQHLLAALKALDQSKRNYTHIRLPVNPLLFSVLLKRHLDSLSGKLDFTRLLEIGPGTSAAALYLRRTEFFIESYMGVENTVPLFILQKLLAELATVTAKMQPQRPTIVKNVTAYEWHQTSYNPTLVLANHCLTEIDEFARRSYIYRLSRLEEIDAPPICGIGFGGKRTLGVPLIEQYRDLLRNLRDQGLILAYYRGFRDFESLSELKFFCFLESKSVDALQIRLPGKNPVMLSLQDYDILSGQFSPEVDVYPVIKGENWGDNFRDSSKRNLGISIEQVIGGAYEETIEEKFIRETRLKR